MDAKQAHQRDYYAQEAAHYDQRWRRENPNHLYKIGAIGRCFDEHLPASPDGYDFLEVGGGTGIHAAQFLRERAGLVRSFVLSDLSADMLAQAKTRLGGFAQVRYLVAPGEALGTEQHFDGIYVSSAMHHFSRPERAIAEMRAHLKPGGCLVICEPIVWNPVNFARAVSMREDWGQFIVTRRRVRRWLLAQGLALRVDRVLHWKAGHPFAERLWPYERLAAIGVLDPLAVMFLLAARRLEGA